MSNTVNVSDRATSAETMKVVGAMVFDGPSLEDLRSYIDYNRRNNTRKSLPFDLNFKIRTVPARAIGSCHASANTCESETTVRASLMKLEENLENCEDFMVDVTFYINELSFVVSRQGFRSSYVSRKIGEVVVRYNTENRTGFVKDIKDISG